MREKLLKNFCAVRDKFRALLSVSAVTFISWTYRTKCLKMYFKTLKLIGGNLFNRPRRASKRQLRSVFTSIFRLDDAPLRDRTDASRKKNGADEDWKGTKSIINVSQRNRIVFFGRYLKDR